ncbi:alpha/beta hydrolase fold domain-containing protein [Sarocladium implicatum]|nr:alpha/beta hydrolase fold domain-containing protein [Sarocladium implicatum]
MDGLNHPPLLWPPITWFTRCLYVSVIYIIKGVLFCQWQLSRAKAALSFTSRPSNSPTFSKSYSIRPKLTHRLFFPDSYDSGTLLPLYIDIHGGGFAFGAPAYDDEFCKFLSQKFRFLVISIQYSLSPSATFPTPVHDVIAVVEAILSDDSLPIDRSRVAIGGFSAGGNLALSASQAPSLQGKIKAVVPWYAPVDWSVSYDFKLNSRAYRHAKDVDGLAALAPVFNNVYLPTGTDQRNPLLSTMYAKRSDLPEYIFAIGAEYDMLNDEARRMMVRLSGESKVTGEELVAFEREDGRLRWRMVLNVEHSFTHWWLKRGDQTEARLLAEQWFTEAGRWLVEEAFAG